jgi:hypothetical protein
MKMTKEFQEALKIERQRIKECLKKKPRQVPGDVTSKRLNVLRDILLRLRWDDQGGFVSLHNRRWDFVSTSLPQVTPEELDSLFKLVGIVPDEIVSAGLCKDCAFSAEGYERGYAEPCCGCLRPLHSRFKPRKIKRKLPSSKKGK